MAIIGAVSALTLILLLVHIIKVSFLPLCLSALNIQRPSDSLPHHSSTGYSDIASPVSGPDRKSTMTGVQSSTGIEERRARARALEVSRLVSNYPSVLSAKVTSPEV